LDFDRFKFTGLETHPTSNAFLRIDLERFPLLLLSPLNTRDGLHRAGFSASPARRTDIGEDPVPKKLPANLCRAFLIDDVLFVFIPEIRMVERTGFSGFFQ
jgi:hypothetical protein